MLRPAKAVAIYDETSTALLTIYVTTPCFIVFGRHVCVHVPDPSQIRIIPVERISNKRCGLPGSVSYTKFVSVALGVHDTAVFEHISSSG